MAYTLPHIIEGVVVLAVVAVLVWRLAPAWVFTLALILSVFAGNWQQIGLPGAFAPERWLLVLGVAAVLLRAPGSANRPRLRPELTHALLALVAIYAVVSALVAGTLLQKSAAFELFDDLGILPFVVFLVVPVVFSGERERRILIFGMIGLGAYLGLTALFETLKLHSLIVPSYIDNPAVGIHYGRARGPFVEAVTNGVGLFACALACGLGLTIVRRARERITIAVIMGLCVAGLLFTLQRSVWIAGAVAGLGLLLFVPSLRRWIIPGVAAAALVVGIPLLTSPTLRSKVQGRANQQGTVWDRQNQDRAALNMINARPLLGFGWAEFKTKSIDYYQQAGNYPLTGFGLDVHDVYLRYGAELGLIGVTLWIAAIVMTLVGALLRRGPPMLYPWKVVAAAFVVFYLIIAATVPAQTFPNLVLWMLLGLAWTTRRESALASEGIRVARMPERPRGPRVGDPAPLPG
ncbi:MAG: O-antigen ligase family protein [Solirubrobacterales bacterium]|nr:O-antigen ligase family protein [Solirubrobacterales bacterium]